MMNIMVFSFHTSVRINMLLWAGHHDSNVGSRICLFARGIREKQTIQLLRPNTCIFIHVDIGDNNETVVTRHYLPSLRRVRYESTVWTLWRPNYSCKAHNCGCDSWVKLIVLANEYANCYWCKLLLKLTDRFSKKKLAIPSKRVFRKNVQNIIIGYYWLNIRFYSIHGTYSYKIIPVSFWAFQQISILEHKKQLLT